MAARAYVSLSPASLTHFSIVILRPFSTEIAASDPGELASYTSPPVVATTADYSPSVSSSQKFSMRRGNSSAPSGTRPARPISRLHGSHGGCVTLHLRPAPPIAFSFHTTHKENGGLPAAGALHKVQRSWKPASHRRFPQCVYSAIGQSMARASMDSTLHCMHGISSQPVVHGRIIIVSLVLN
jgi:hypothetical protein